MRRLWQALLTFANQFERGMVFAGLIVFVVVYLFSIGWLLA